MSSVRKGLWIVAAIFSLALPTWGIVYIEITSPNLRLYRLAYLWHCPDPSLGGTPDRIIRRCLEISYLFDPIPEANLPQKGFLTPDKVNHQAFKEVGAEFVLSASAWTEGGEVVLGFFAYDPVQGITIGGKRYRGPRAALDLMAYKLVDDFLELLTGSPGPFSSRIAFVKSRDGFRELWMAYPDGRNARPLVREWICMSPSWSPDGKRLLFTGFKRMNPDLYLLDLASGNMKLLSSAPGPNSAAQWSPDGKNIALSMRGEKGELDLYLLDPSSGKATPLTRTPYVETSPSWSPDGKKIAFVSDRTGSPQIYLLDLATKAITPLTRFGSYNCSPRWSPRGDWIAFSGRWEGEFKIFVIRPDGSDLRLVTPYKGNHEDPAFAPNGRHLVFSSDRGGGRDLYITTLQGGGPWAITLTQEDESQPAWSPLLR